MNLCKSLLLTVSFINLCILTSCKDEDLTLLGKQQAASLLNNQHIQKDKYSESVLVAAAAGNKGLLRLLISAGADVNVSVKKGPTALQLAAESGCDKCVKLILGNKQFNRKHYAHMPQFLAVLEENYAEEAVCFRNEITRDERNSLLGMAAGLGIESAVRILLDCDDIDVNTMPSIYGFNQTSMAPALHRAAARGRIKCLKLLISDNRTEINKREMHGLTALELAAMNGQTESIKLLMHAPDLDKGQNGQLMLAAATGNEEELISLLEKETNIENIQMAFEIATCRGHSNCVKHLMSLKGVDINKGKIAAPILHAIQNNHVECLKHILDEQSVDINKTSMGVTPLQAAILSSNNECVKLLLNDPRIKVNEAGESMLLPLIMGLQKKDIKSVELLLKHPSLDANKGNPVCVALMVSSVECFRALLNTKNIKIQPNDFQLAITLAKPAHLLAMLESPGLDVQFKSPLYHAIITAAPEKLKSLLQEEHNHDVINNSLRMAAALGNRQCLKLLLSIPEIDINYRNEKDGTNLLHLSAMNNREQCIQELMAMPGIKVHVDDFTQCTPLDYAIAKGYIGCVQQLLMKPIPESENRYGMQQKKNSPIHTAAAYGQARCLAYLLSTHDSLRNDMGTKGESPLHTAAGAGQLECLKLLKEELYRTVDLMPNHGLDQSGKSPLTWAIESGEQECAEFLIKNRFHEGNPLTTTYSRTFDGYSLAPFPVAIRNHEFGIAKLLLDNVGGVIGFEESLLEALNKGDQRAVNFILRTSHYLDYSISESDKKEVEESVLNYAATFGYPKILSDALAKGKIKRELLCKALTTAAKNGHTGIVGMLLAAPGIDVNEEVDYNTPLEVASENGHTKILKILLAIPGIDVNKNSPLARAADEGHTEIVKMLLAAPGIDVNKENPLAGAALYGHSEIVKLLLTVPGIDVNTGWPLYWSARKGHTEIVKMLLAAPGIDVNKENPLAGAALYGHSEIVKLLLTVPGIDVNTGWPLARAAVKGHTEIVKMLLAAPEIDVNKESPLYWSALSAAAENGHTEIVKMLLAAPGIDVNKGFSLYHAAKNGHTEIVKMLLVSPDIKVNEEIDYDTPLEIAAKNGHTEIVKLLKESLGKAHNKSSTTNISETSNTQKDAQYWVKWHQTTSPVNDLSYMRESYEPVTTNLNTGEKIELDNLIREQQTYVKRWEKRQFNVMDFATRGNRIEIRCRYTCTNSKGKSVSGYSKTTLIISGNGRIEAFADDSSSKAMPEFSNHVDAPQTL